MNPSSSFLEKAIIPQQVKAAVAEIDAEAEVILFGSRARGDFRADSDWDFLVLVSQPLDDALATTIRNRLYEIELEVEEVIVAIIEEKARWHDFAVTPFYQNVAEDGMLIE